MSDIPVGRDFWLDLRHQIARGIRHPSDAGTVLHSVFGTFHRHRPQNTVTDTPDFLVRTARSLDEIAASQRRLGRVQADIDRLPPKTREIFIMHRWYEMKYQEIADNTGISIDAVEEHVANAMLSLANWNDKL